MGKDIISQQSQIVVDNDDINSGSNIQKNNENNEITSTITSTRPLSQNLTNEINMENKIGQTDTSNQGNKNLAGSNTNRDSYRQQNLPYDPLYNTPQQSQSQSLLEQQQQQQQLQQVDQDGMFIQHTDQQQQQQQQQYQQQQLQQQQQHPRFNDSLSVGEPLSRRHSVDSSLPRDRLTDGSNPYTQQYPNPHVQQFNPQGSGTNSFNGGQGLGQGVGQGGYGDRDEAESSKESGSYSKQENNNFINNKQQQQQQHQMQSSQSQNKPSMASSLLVEGISRMMDFLSKSPSQKSMPQQQDKSPSTSSKNQSFNSGPGSGVPGGQYNHTPYGASGTRIHVGIELIVIVMLIIDQNPHNLIRWVRMRVGRYLEVQQ